MYLRKLKKHKNDVSLQDFAATDRDGNSVSYEEKIPDEGMSVEERASIKSELKEISKKIDRNLSLREKTIIKLRYGIGCKAKTQQEIADSMGISRSYVSRIEKAALLKLKK